MHKSMQHLPECEHGDISMINVELCASACMQCNLSSFYHDSSLY